MGFFSNIGARYRAWSAARSFKPSHMASLTDAQKAINREKLQDCFASSNWSKLNSNAKLRCLQALENDFADQQGRPALPVKLMSDNYSYGCYSPDDDAIFVNENLVHYGTFTGKVTADNPVEPDANIQLYDTIAHEGYHAYQNYAMRYPENHKDKHQLTEWGMNEGCYYPSEVGDKYLIQPQERDAWNYGYTKTKEAFDGIEARVGKEPGRDEYEKMARENSYHQALAREQASNPNVLHDMKTEMTEACRSRGFNYDYEDPNRIPSMVQNTDNYSVKAREGTPDLSSAKNNPGPETGKVQSQSKSSEGHTPVQGAKGYLLSI